MTNRSVQVLIAGNVQGCGLRPQLARLAYERSWSGSVRNTTAGVELRLCGPIPENGILTAIIEQSLPSVCELDHLFVTDLPGYSADGFRIENSLTQGELATAIPRDRAICRDCLCETKDPANRRYRYPFTSCTTCGPRYSVSIGMPFDRELTTLTEFPLCSECQREYEDPADRRFHAQTICCPECGPRVWLEDRSQTSLAWNDEAIIQAADAVIRGEIVALRGVGGYQLLVDATNDLACQRLRERKRRPAKPFAVLCADLDQARSLAVIGPMDESQLVSAENPIVIVRQRSTSGLSSEINPGMTDVGLLLPTSALHARFIECTGRPLICTSGNRDGEPMAWQVADAREQLRGIANCFLHHNREIHHPIDDSVVRVIAGRSVTIRSGRGLAPMSLPLKCRTNVVAVGAQQKATIATSTGSRTWLSPHIGDLDTIACQNEWLRRLGEISDSHRRVAFDPHPDYFTTQYSKTLDAEAISVWHHHAHIVAGMLEQGWLDRTVLGVAFDGTGLGPDGTVWGGEFLIADATTFRRVAHLRPFSLPPGEAAIGDQRTLTLAFLAQLNELTVVELSEILEVAARDVRLRLQAFETNWSARSTSCGRLFDAVSFLACGRNEISYEGQAAMILESACDPAESSDYQFSIDESETREIDWRPVLRQILVDRHRCLSAGSMAMKFHRGLAKAIIAVARNWPQLPVVLSGGVFQNRVLTELIQHEWPSKGSPLGLPGAIPPNDGGLAAGQLASAEMQMKQKGDSYVPRRTRARQAVD